MRIAIEHQIEYSFSDPASYAIQHIRGIARNSPSQQIRRWYITVGRQDRFVEFLDCFGNTVYESTHIDPHESSQVHISGLVDTVPSDGILSDQDEPLPLLFYLADTAQTEISEDVLDLVSAVRVATDKEPIDGLHRLMEEVGKELTYKFDIDAGPASAAEALQRATGASGDHAHVFIACARALDIPARFVTGYRLPGGDDDVAVDEPGFAWAEAWVDKLGWVGFDAVHQASPTEAYVRIACGADHLTAQTIRRSQRGGGEQTATSDLQVSQVQAPQ